jgi:hypothetical protein
VRLLSTLVAISALAASSCSTSSSGGPDDPGSAAPATVTTGDTDVFTGDGAESPGSVSTTRGFPDGPLADVCPAAIDIQLAGLPGVAVGALFTLISDAPEIDTAAQSVAGIIRRPDGTAEDVRLVLRSGGPAVAFRDSVDVLADDATLTLAQTSTASAVLRSDNQPTTGVVALTDVSHDVVIWDPATYPDIDGFSELREQQTEIRHVTDAPLVDFLVANGTLDAEQMVPGFDGEPAAFVEAGGAIAQQGDLLVDVALLPSLPQWARPVSYVAAADAGWASYDDTIVARTSDLAELAECLGRLVPVIQSAIVAYRADPSPVNALLADARAQFDPLTRLTADLMDAGARLAAETGTVSAAGDAPVGDFEAARLTSFVPELVAATGSNAVEVDGLFTNQFIDPAIG